MPKPALRVPGASYYRRPEERPRFTWVFFPGAWKTAQMVAARNDDGETIDPSSMFGPFEDDDLLTVNLPNTFERFFTWDLFFRQIQTMLRSHGAERVILVGLSRGGQVANAFYRWHWRLPEHEGTIGDVGLAMISTPDSLASLHPGPRRGVRLMQYSVPASLGELALRHFPGLFVDRAARRLLEVEGVSGRLLPGIYDSIRVSRGWSRSALRDLAQHQGFGHMLEIDQVKTEADSHVMVGHLAPACDEIVRVELASARARQTYLWAPRIEIGATLHGQPEIEPGPYQEFLCVVAEHFSRVMNVDPAHS